MAGSIGFFVLGLVLLLLGGDSVVKGASGLAQRLGWSPFKAGLLLVAVATSIPELAVNAYAVAKGQGDLALGNAIGSNIVNIGLTLGVAALAAPLLIHMRLLAAEVVFLLVATGATFFFSLDHQIARWEGSVLLLGFVGMMVFQFARGRHESADVQRELTEFAETRTGLVQNLIRLVMAAAVLFFGAQLVVVHAPVIGLALGFGSMLTGLLVVAIGTALPEVVTAVLAARRGHANVVAGQVIGASLFNLLFVVGGMAVFKPLSVPVSFTGFELPAAMAFVLALYPILAGDLRVSRREGSVLVVLFLAWLGFELFLAWR
ncbi:MAG TPA: sodium:calcium antiporter [Arenimonas sp.]|uniref:sodium:calcium antiporter n=1 Tax=Arenimonas sp. TaxID=1872635 RepID=UPI002CCE6468|nr:sodium:calcium antiporter [Arenimonas sp.]HMB57561.1 sodium:calcium antiporter [Arenimonas sp.]